jgi:general secretion pathway protein C
MVLLRKVCSLAVPASVALIAFLHAHAIGALIDGAAAPASIAPFAEARASTGESGARKSADALLERNPFDHLTRRATSVDAFDQDAGGPMSAPLCDGVRAIVTVRSADADSSLAALDIGGRRVLRRRASAPPTDVGTQLVYVGEDRVWLSQGGALCQAPVFGGTAVARGGGAQLEQSAFEKEVGAKIHKTGPREFQIDHAAVDRILEAQTELMKTPLVPEKEGDRVIGFRLGKIRSGSVFGLLGLESGDRLEAINGIDVTTTDRMLEAYAKLRSGMVDRLTLHITRSGMPVNLDYVVR